MNRRNFFRALSALAALPLAKLCPQTFASGGLVEAPKPALLVGEHVHIYMQPKLNEDVIRAINAQIKKGFHSVPLRIHRAKIL